MSMLYQQPDLPGGDDAAPDAPPGFFPLRLVVPPGGDAVELTRPDMLLGRHTDADVRLSLPEVSRRHCRFVFTNGGWEVYDLNSLNGLYVNGQRVRQTALRHDDLVAVGSFRLRVDLGGEADPAPPTESESLEKERVLLSIAQALPAPVHERRAS